MSKLDDFVKYENQNDISLRTNIVTSLIITKVEINCIVKIVRDLLILILSNISNSVSSWTDIQFRLMKVNLLHTKIKIPHIKIKEILRIIKSYYNDKANYWNQVGIVEEKLGDYNRTLNNFKQSEVLNPNSYLVQNALARNYLRMANFSLNIEQAKLFFIEGKTRMLKLIRHRDDFQAKAYTTHSYIQELIQYWSKFNIAPTKEEIIQAISILRAVIDQDKNDMMATNIAGQFFAYLKEKKLSKYIPTLRLDNIIVLKGLISYEE